MIEKQISSLKYALVTASLVVGVVAVSAIASNYSGNVQLKFGSNGIELKLNGQSNAADNFNK